MNDEKVIPIQRKMQEFQYKFPYHYLPIFEPGNIRPTRYWGWWIQYFGRIRLIMDFISQYQPRSLLDVGCGDGRLINILSNAPKFEHIYYQGVDISKRSIQLARSLNDKKNVVFDVVDLFSGRLNSVFDIIIFMEVLEHIEPDKLIDFVAKSLRYLIPGGYTLVTVPSNNLSPRKKHYQHFTLAEITSILEDVGLKILHGMYIDSYSWIMRVLHKLLYNRLVIINSSMIIDMVLKYYIKNELYADRSVGKGLFLVCKKN